MQLCDDAFVPNGDLPQRITEEVKKNDLKGYSINYLSLMISHTIIHELTHAVSLDGGEFKVTDLPDKDHAYGWNNVITKAAPIAVTNADNYAYLGLWAIIADFGYTLSRVGEKDHEEDAVEGYLDRYNDVTKRMLRPMMFAA